MLHQGVLTGSDLQHGFARGQGRGVASLVAPVENLALVLLPSAGLGIGLELLFPNGRMLLASAPLGMRLHDVLSVTTYRLLTHRGAASGANCLGRTAAANTPLPGRDATLIAARCAQFQHQIALIGKNHLALQLPRIKGLLEHGVGDPEFPRQRSQTRLIHA